MAFRKASGSAHLERTGICTSGDAKKLHFLNHGTYKTIRTEDL